MGDVNSHDVAARMFQAIRDAQDGKTLDAILNLGLNYWVAGTLDIGTIEAATYRAIDRARELPMDVREYPPINTNPLPEAPPEDYADMEQMAKDRKAFELKRKRHHASGCSRRAGVLSM